MARMKLKYVQEFVDRHGTTRRYFRKGGCPKIALPGLPGSKEFQDAYQAALATVKSDTLKKAVTIPAGSVAALIRSYKTSAAYTDLKPLTRRTYDGVLRSIEAEHGHRPAATMPRAAIVKIMDGFRDRPGAAKNHLVIWRMLCRRAMDLGWRDDDPTFGVRMPKQKGTGFKTWTEAEIAQYEAHHKNGSRERLALALLLYTGQRRGDVVSLGRQHVRNNRISLRQSKTGQVVDIPILPELAAEIDASVTGDLTFLITSFGKPFSQAGFGNWFRDACNAAGLNELSAHGLRKAAARRLAEAGCSDREIMAITGHKTHSEITRYTSAANRAAMADSAVEKFRSRKTKSDPQ